MARRNRHLDRISLGAALLSLIAVVFGCFWLFRAVEAPFLAFAVMSGVVFWLASQPSLAEAWFNMAAAPALGVLYFQVHPNLGPYPFAMPVAIGAFLGLSSILILAWRGFRNPESLPDFLLAAFAPVSMIAITFALWWTTALQPATFDAQLAAFDRMLGLDFSAEARALVSGAAWLSALCQIVYAALPLAMAILIAHARHWKDTRLLASFAAAGAAAFVLYQICPATGPAHTGPQAPRNALPSLHATWALLLYLRASTISLPARIAAAVFLVITLVATLGLGEHYLIDLVVAVPFTLAIHAAVRKRWWIAVPAMAGVVGWLVLLRLNPPFPAPLAWSLVAATLAAGWRRAEDRLPAT